MCNIVSTIGRITHDNYYCTRFKDNGSNLFFVKPNQIIILYNTYSYYERFVMHTRTIVSGHLRTYCPSLQSVKLNKNEDCISIKIVY